MKKPVVNEMWGGYVAYTTYRGEFVTGFSLSSPEKALERLEKKVARIRRRRKAKKAKSRKRR